MLSRRNYFVSLGQWLLIPLKSIAYVFKIIVLSCLPPGDPD